MNRYKVFFEKRFLHNVTLITYYELVSVKLSFIFILCDRINKKSFYLQNKINQVPNF